MPSINLEMMKQLLEEFSEKETLTAEEIGIVEKEISNLEERVNASQVGLSQVPGKDASVEVKASKRSKDRLSADNTTSEQALITPNPSVALHTNTETDSQQIDPVQNDSEPPAKDSGKPMKSINEALKGLFSK
jgi:hypothetical protein